MKWLDEIPSKVHRDKVERHLRCNRSYNQKLAANWISSVNYQPAPDEDNSIKKYEIYIRICEHHRYSLKFLEESEGQTKVKKRLNDYEFEESPPIIGTCAEVSLDWLLNFFEEMTDFGFINVSLTPVKETAMYLFQATMGTVAPVIKAHKIWMNGHFINENNQFVKWWLSHFKPIFYAIHIEAKDKNTEIKDHEHLRIADLLYLKGYTDLDKKTFLNFKGVYLRIDDWSEPPLNYDGNVVVTIIKKWVSDDREHDMIINNASISTEFWKPIEEYLKKTYENFEKNEEQVCFQRRFGGFILMVQCMSGHISASYYKYY